MQVQAKIEYECGRYSCASEPGKFCRWLGTRRFGSVYLCMLYPSKEDSFTVLAEDEGILRRCNACLEACDPKIGEEIAATFRSLLPDQQHAIVNSMGGAKQVEPFLAQVMRKEQLSILWKKIDETLGSTQKW